MTLKYSLTAKQEEKFWRTIAVDLAEKLSLPEDRTKWQLSHRKAINKAMRISLYELCKKDDVAAGLCNLFDSYEELRSGQRSFLSTIHSYFGKNLKKRTHNYNKHRFAFFLTGKSANEYIEDKDILTQNTQADKSLATLSTMLSLKEYKYISLEENVKSLVNSLEYNATRIQKELLKNPEQEEYSQFLIDFTALHGSLIKHLVEKKDIQTGMKIYADIYFLAWKNFLQAKEDIGNSIFDRLGGRGFYLRNNSLVGKISSYLSLDESFAETMKRFVEKADKADPDYYHFYLQLLDWHSE